MLFSKPIDSLAAAGAILADVWVDNVKMPVVDCLGDEFLDYVKDGMTITLKDDGLCDVAWRSKVCFANSIFISVRVCEAHFVLVS